MMKPVKVYETLDLLTRLEAQKNTITVNAYVNRIRLPQSTRVVLWRDHAAETCVYSHMLALMDI
jgi:hypothetical protein